VRLPRVVARAALIASLALIVVPGSAGSRVPTAPGAIDSSRFETIDLGYETATMATTTLDPAHASDGRLEFDAVLREPAPLAGALAPRPNVSLPTAHAIESSPWHYDGNISWYGPGFYGNNGACGMVPGGIQKDTVGVAHRTLPCGTRVAFRYNGRTVITQVIDRGPYVAGRTWDMTRGLCALLDHCFTGGGVYYRILG
jgi:rare lipoprotein A (peptidoglycan hydrolase)